ncbi:MAG: serine/threonine protein kinase [Lachnospiraceae bacterium]|nr:serine/threonine protein kinase [Lachnospiraceae bacterium]
MKITKCMSCMEELNEDKEICPHCGFSEEETPSLPHQLPYRSVLKGKYMVGKVLGEGGFGITYIGWDLNLGIKVAIKEFYPEGFVGRDGTQSHTVRSYQGDSTVFFNKGKDKFLEEARSLGKFMQLDGIVSVKDFFMENNTVYIVMEFLEGQSLKSYAKEKGGKIEAEELLTIMKPVLESLIEVHKSGLIHRDISPDNIMICKDGKIKLIDFGAAREASPEGEKTLSVMLKKGYSPEEQYRTHGEQGTWTDVYALSATIYAMMTGYKPDEPLDRMERETLMSLTDMGIKLKKRQEDVILKGLEIKATDRVQTVEELYRGLYKDGKENEFAIRRKKKVGKLVAILAGVLAVLCIAAGVVYMLTPQWLTTVIWVEAQVGQNISTADIMDELPKDAKDVAFYMNDVMTGNLSIQGKPENGDCYELEVHYKQGIKTMIQQMEITVVEPEIKATIETITYEKGHAADIDTSWFVAEHADYLKLNIVNETNHNVAQAQKIQGFLLNGENVVGSATFIVDYYDLDAEEEQLLALIGQENTNQISMNDDLEKCADTLIDNAMDYDIKEDWGTILEGSIEKVTEDYPEVAYKGAFMYPVYAEDGKIAYTAEAFYELLMQTESVSEGLMTATDIGLEARTVYTEDEGAAIYWCLFYR